MEEIGRCESEEQIPAITQVPGWEDVSVVEKHTGLQMTQVKFPALASGGSQLLPTSVPKCLNALLDVLSHTHTKAYIYIYDNIYNIIYI